MEKKMSSRVKKTREKILESARGIFVEKGYQSTTIREVAITAEVNDLTVYRHFQNKENLFYEMMIGQSFLKGFSERMHKGFSGDYIKDLHSIYRLLEGFMEEQAPLLRLLILESIKIGSCHHVTVEIKKRVLTDVTYFFAFYQEKGAISKEMDAHSLAEALYSFVFTRMFYQLFSENESCRIKENPIEKELLGLIINGTQIQPNCS